MVKNIIVAIRVMLTACDCDYCSGADQIPITVNGVADVIPEPCPAGKHGHCPGEYIGCRCVCHKPHEPVDKLGGH